MLGVILECRVELINLQSALCEVCCRALVLPCNPEIKFLSERALLLLQLIKQNLADIVNNNHGGWGL
jgi:hypothetical protein